MTPTTLPRWKLFLGRVALVTVAVVAARLLLPKPHVKTHGREEFIGKIDPVSGVRCRLTVPLGYERSDSSLPSRHNRILDSASFETPSGPTLSRPDSEPPKIHIESSKAEDITDYIRIQAGYPERVKHLDDAVVAQRHTLVDGRPANLLQMSRPYYGRTLYVYVPNANIVYRVTVIAEPPDAEPIDREMQAILSSFRVEQAAVPMPVNR